jgi:predicted HAD superfamily phosphohydrolase YqeG
MIDTIRPTIALPSVEHVPHILPDHADRNRGALIGYDVDGTLTDYHGELEERIRKVLLELEAQEYQQCVISNAYDKRAEWLRDTFTGDPELRMRVYTPADVAPEGERIKKYRKPSPAMFMAAIREHDVRPKAAIMVGDQLLKDVWSGNRIPGARTVLVPRYGEGDDPNVRRFQRPVEARLLDRMSIRFACPVCDVTHCAHAPAVL